MPDFTSLNSPGDTMALKYHEALADDNLYHNSIHALSLIDFHEPISDQSELRFTRNVTKKHVELLEGLALLLVSSEDEVVATGFLIEPGTVKVLWAKSSNTNTMMAKEGYIQEFIAKLTARGSTVDTILDHIIPFCNRKIVGRCQELARAFEVSPSGGDHPEPFFSRFNQDNLDYLSLESNLQRLGYIRPATPLNIGLRTFLKWVAKVKLATSPDILAQVISLSYGVTNIKPTIVKLVTPDQWNCFQRLGDYRLSCDRVLRHVLSLPPQIRKNITAVQLLPTNPPKTVQVHSSIVDALNTWTHAFPHNPPVPSLDKLQLSYSRAHPGLSLPGDTTNITAAQHPELTIALHLADFMQNRKLRGTIKLGVSEGSCYWCDRYLWCLERFLKPEICIVYRANIGDGKCSQGWLVPEQPISVTREMLKYIGLRMQGVFDGLKGAEEIRWLQGFRDWEEIGRNRRYNGPPLFGWPESQ